MVSRCGQFERHFADKIAHICQDLDAMFMFWLMFPLHLLVLMLWTIFILPENVEEMLCGVSALSLELGPA